MRLSFYLPGCAEQHDVRLGGIPFNPKPTERRAPAGLPRCERCLCTIASPGLCQECAEIEQEVERVTFVSPRVGN
jgi:hypothetical protein